MHQHRAQDAPRTRPQVAAAGALLYHNSSDSFACVAVRASTRSAMA